MPRVISQPFCVVGAIIEKDGKIALVKESCAGKPDCGKWNQPAGWLDVGEDPVAGAKREVEEETGFTFTPKAILGISSLVRKDIEKQVIKRKLKGIPHAIKIIFVGNVITDGQKDLSTDVSDLKWFTPEEIYAMDISTLRDVDIKKLVKDYFGGKRYPLDLIQHATQNQNSF